MHRIRQAVKRIASRCLQNVIHLQRMYLMNKVANRYTETTRRLQALTSMLLDDCKLGGVWYVL